MAYDYLGTLTAAQWTSLKSFISLVVAEADAQVENLQWWIEKQDDFTAKLIRAEAVTSGVSSFGFPGQLYTPEDLGSASVGQTTESKDSELLNYLYENRPNRASFASPADCSSGSFAAGDYPWLDTPQIPQPSNQRGAVDDAHTSVYVAWLKDRTRRHIEFFRQELEDKIKQGLDHREQLHIHIFFLQQFSDKSQEMIQAVDDQFGFTDPGTDRDDPQAQPLDIEKADRTLLKSAVDDSVQQLFRNLWEAYPPTRYFPQWPLLPEKERGVQGMIDD